MTTNKQKAAIDFCERILHITFEGNLEDFFQVSSFLSKHLDEAKSVYLEIACDYEAYMWNLD